MKLMICFSLIFLFAGSLFTQSDSSVFVVPEMKIYQMEKGKEVIYEFDRSDNLVYLLNDTLKVSPQFYNYSAGLESVNKISFRNGSHFWKGAAVGAIFGYLLGFFGYGLISDMLGWEKGPVAAAPITGFLVAIPLGLIG